MTTIQAGQQLSDLLGTTEELERLVAARDALLALGRSATSPAVARALEMADDHIFLAMTYLGYVDQVFPNERPE